MEKDRMMLVPVKHDSLLPECFRMLWSAPEFSRVLWSVQLGCGSSSLFPFHISQKTTQSCLLYLRPFQVIGTHKRPLKIFDPRVLAFEQALKF